MTGFPLIQTPLEEALLEDDVSGYVWLGDTWLAQSNAANTAQTDTDIDRSVYNPSLI